MDIYTPAMDRNPNTPVILSTALRVPSDSYFPEWGIPEGAFREESDRAYAVEWEGGGPNQMDNVILALKSAGMLNYSQILRDANTEFVKAYMKRRKGPVHYLEVGFGESTRQMFEALDGNEKDRIIITGVEPSEERARTSEDNLAGMGMTRGENLNVYVGIDNDILNKGYAEPGSQDIIANVAAFHHHAYLDTPMRVIYMTLADRGVFVSSDWHNSMWEHPGRVYGFLRTLEWEGKEEDLADFAERFPYARKRPPKLSEMDRGANADIRNFWRGWIKARAEAKEKGEFTDADDIWMLEAHRPAGRYAEVMKGAGLVLKSPDIEAIYRDAGFEANPHYHLKYKKGERNGQKRSSLLATIAGQKLIITE